MPDTPTPGAIARAAYWAVLTPHMNVTVAPFAQINALHQAAWDAAAEAVLASWLEEQGWRGNTAWLVKLREQGERHPLPLGEEEPRGK